MQLGGAGGITTSWACTCSISPLAWRTIDDRARIDTDDIVAEIAGEHGDVAAVAIEPRRRPLLRSRRRRSRRGRHAARRKFVVLCAGEATGSTGGSRRRAGAADCRVAGARAARTGRRQAGAGEGDAIDFRAAVSAIAGQAQRAAVLRMLTGADDRHGNGIAVGVLDGLVVNRDAHARSTVANGPFPARLCGESSVGWRAKLLRMIGSTVERSRTGDTDAGSAASVPGAVGRSCVGLAADGFAVVLAGRRARCPRGDRFDDRRRSRWCMPTDVTRCCQCRCVVRSHRPAIRPARPVVQQRRCRCPAGAAGRAVARAVAACRRHQPHRFVPVCATGDRDDEAAGSCRWSHHQQRLDLGAHPASQLRAVHGDQARHHRADEVDRPRRPGATASPAARSTSATPNRR